MYNDKIKEQIKEILDNSTNIGEYDDQVFVIFDSWSDIREINKLLGYNDEYDYRQGNDTLNLDQILFWVNSDIPFPLDLDDLQYVKEKLYILELMNKGQLSFVNDIKPDLTIYNPIMKTIREYLDIEDPDIDSLNWDIKNEYIESIEWGFSDEYTNCAECYQNIIRIFPDSYSWDPEFYLDPEYGYICAECSQDYKDQAIREIQDKIDNNEQPKSFPKIFDLEDSWYKIQLRDSFHSWQNGMHHGMNDDPLRQGKIVRSILYEGSPMFEIVFRVYPSQFYIEWDSYIRINPDLDIELNYSDMIDICENLADRFDSPEGRFPYDIASLYEKALKNVNYPYASINVNPEDGSIDIKGSYDINEYIEGLK